MRVIPLDLSSQSHRTGAIYVYPKDGYLLHSSYIAVYSAFASLKQKRINLTRLFVIITVILEGEGLDVADKSNHDLTIDTTAASCSL